MIYLDSAATSFYRPPQVAEAVAEAIRTMGNCSRGTYETALDSARVIFEARQLVNELFDGDGAEQVAFTANSTESLNMAIKGSLKPGDLAVTTVLEHNSVLRPLYQLEEQGVKVIRVGCLGRTDGRTEKRADEETAEAGEDSLRCQGLLDMEALHRSIRPGVKAVIVTHASNLTGNVQDLRRIGDWCRKAGALFIVDASQTAGVLPISMKEDQIDILCFTGHKGLMGPQGTGGLCVRKGIVLEPLLSGGSGIQTYSKRHPLQMPAALEAGTLNGHGIAGLRAALLWIKSCGGVEAIRQHEDMLARTFYQKVKKIPGIRLYGDYRAYEAEEPAMGRAAIVTLNIGDEDSGEVSDWLAQEYQVATRSGGHCAPLMHEALGTVEQGAVRFSFSYFNTMEQVELAAKALTQY
ncbi:MAG: aminotransferase class V-fold PLP-dependent enzyme [Lachnospiraceae bacterium]|nr:aminotransferase class V-fold PLP-dependent enzyme [Lachnospiraceae bacterium]